MRSFALRRTQSSCGAGTLLLWLYRCFLSLSQRFCTISTACYGTVPTIDLDGRYHRDMDTRLLELLVCPITKGPLEYDREKQELKSRSARLAYPIRDGIPILLESEARTLSDEELGL